MFRHSRALLVGRQKRLFDGTKTRFYYTGYTPEPFHPLPRTPVTLKAEEAVKAVKSGMFFLHGFLFVLLGKAKLESCSCR